MSISRAPADITPVLPPELEREIFLLTAQAYRGVSTRLMLVASRVKTWLETFVYKTVVLRCPGHAFQFLYTLAKRPPQFAHSHIKALCIRPQIPLSVTTQLLTLCSGLETLALWTHSQPENPTDITNLLSSTPLTSLSINLHTITTNPTYYPPPALQHHPVFVNLTHLDIVNPWVVWTTSLGIEHLPRLTHLAFRFWSRGSVNAALSRILRESPRLDCEDIRDIRVVVIQHTRDADEWKTIERDAEGMWQRAERVVRWRRLTKAGPFDFPSDGHLSSLKPSFDLP
ncbi:hypothetical protein PAXRUDRAFT_830371 [Paxillus rubicundulus Ve08.2h10]|uniref:F-box domain-containing protein n=1 Tax=Paxillus rubicundulus Ve08.2h10 TaxID=930991 RepID=A0A0D0DTP8_9AGAM|nr:hypothetical protein PAXRUDRAFT_830371 [Paxillus rubicundulus Ve08.2h10]